jgi:hypothetical protein
MEPEITAISDLAAGSSYQWAVINPEGEGVMNLADLGYVDYMPAGHVTTSLSWLFSMTKIEADSGSKILSMSTGPISVSGFYTGVFGTTAMEGADGMKMVLADSFGVDYAFSLGHGSISTETSIPVVSESELDVRMNWDISMSPMIVLGEGAWSPVTTGVLQRFYVDVTVSSTPTITSEGTAAPPIVSGLETFGMIVGEDVDVLFSASSLNPATYSVYKQIYNEEVDFTLDISETTLVGTNVWDGGDILIDATSFDAGKYAVTVIVEDLLGATSQHTTFVLITDADAEHVTTGYSVSSRTAPTSDNVVDSVVSGYIPRPRGSVLDTLMDNKLIIAGVLVGVVVIGGIGFTILTKKPKKAMKTKKKR